MSKWILLYLLLLIIILCSIRVFDKSKILEKPKYMWYNNASATSLFSENLFKHFRIGKTLFNYIFDNGWFLLILCYAYSIYINLNIDYEFYLLRINCLIILYFFIFNL